jgi:hypothetical protein
MSHPKIVPLMEIILQNAEPKTFTTFCRMGFDFGSGHPF